MTKVFHSSSTSKIVSINSDNIIEVNKDNIIESDSEFREVVKKGYLLNNINLSTIPDIIQEAIDNAILDAKTQTLADSLISTMRQTIENFDDGVYKKTYIDQTITYLEQLLTQKASPEIVASIAEAKIAVATAEFATASQVNNLSSRVGSSESEILNVKETINTKDTARATQVEELQASINQSLSNYSEAIALYVDADGIVKSQKIEKLEAGNSISKVTINELNEVVVDENGNYNAMVAKVIFDSDGKIVGFNFSDTNELTTFTINADVFKISNSTNTKTPFTIVGNDIFLDAKVTFSNITDKSSVITMENVEAAIRDNVTTIDGGKIATDSIGAGQIEAYAITGKNITGGTINGTEINGTEINGAVINGAVINGAVIKASYLDLDGAIQVLTNYHLCITQAKLNAVIAGGGTGALYTNSNSMHDAIPIIIPDPVTGIDVIDEYRIPSLSVLNWNGGSASTGSYEFFVSGTFSSSLNTSLYAYNVANAGVNTKAVKIRPIMSISAINMKTGVYGINELSAPSSIAHCIMYFGNIQLCKLRLWTHPQESHSPIRFTIDRYGQSSLDGINTQLDGVTFTVLGISFSVSSSLYDYPADPNGNPTGRDVETTIIITKDIGELGFDFLSGSIRFEVYAEKPTFSDCRASVSSSVIHINNMV